MRNFIETSTFQRLVHVRSYNFVICAYLPRTCLIFALVYLTAVDCLQCCQHFKAQNKNPAEYKCVLAFLADGTNM